MYQLTIDGDRHVMHSSEHADEAGARRELARWADRADCELRPIQMHADFSSWDVVAVEDNRSRGAATIEALARVSAPYAPPSGPHGCAPTKYHRCPRGQRPHT